MRQALDRMVIKELDEPTLTERYNFKYKMEMMLKKRLHKVVCLKHHIELPLRHLFMNLDGTTTTSGKYCGKKTVITLFLFYYGGQSTRFQLVPSDWSISRRGFRKCGVYSRTTTENLQTASK